MTQIMMVFKTTESNVLPMYVNVRVCLTLILLQFAEINTLDTSLGVIRFRTGPLFFLIKFFFQMLTLFVLTYSPGGRFIQT